MTVEKSVEEMLKNDLQIEYQVADHLKKAAEICETNQDFVSRDMLVKQIEDTEMDHAYFLEKQIRLIELVGLEKLFAEPARVRTRGSVMKGQKKL